jgi:hypothetical protein
MTFDDMHTLREAVRRWRPGDPLPDALLNFPSPRAGSHLRCGMRMFGECVGDYLFETPGADLLRAVILEPRTGDDTLRAALRESLRVHGFAWTVAVLDDAATRNPDLLRRTAVADLPVHLASPCLRLKIARFDKHRPVPLDRAWQVLRTMRDGLRARVGWQAAYATASEALRDDSGHEPGEAFHGPTHLNYAFDGGATPEYVDPIGGFDLRTYQYASIPAGHLERLFAAKGGTHLIDTEPAVWLYHVEEYFAGRGNQPGAA